MIILGDKYKFGKNELRRLKKKFSYVTHVSYKNNSYTQNIEIIENLIKDEDHTTIVLNTAVILPHELLTYLTKLELVGIDYISLEDFLEKYLNKCYIDPNNNITSLDNIYSYTPLQFIQKRTIDYLAILFLLPVTLISIIVTWYKIKQESPGSLFFKQKRIGIYEKEFTCLKLRSMNMNAEQSGAIFASKNDPRTFPWGKKIRHAKLDELIQLWNVFKGEMHFVGPRPERKIWTKEFSKSIPCYNQRHVVAPGITGLAQVKYQYGSGKLDAYQKLMYDLYYIKNWNLQLELEIIWKTLLFVTTKRRKDLSNF